VGSAARRWSVGTCSHAGAWVRDRCIAEPAYAELVAPDEQRFLDMSEVEFIVCDEPTVVIDDLGPQSVAPGVSR